MTNCFMSNAGRLSLLATYLRIHLRGAINRIASGKRHWTGQTLEMFEKHDFWQNFSLINIMVISRLG